MAQEESIAKKLSALAELKRKEAELQDKNERFTRSLGEEPAVNGGGQGFNACL